MDRERSTHNVQPAMRGSKKVWEKRLPRIAGDPGLNLSGAINAKEHKVLIQEDEMLNAETTMSFLRKLDSTYPEKTKSHLFYDNNRYYRNKAVTEDLKTSKG